jgi:hypothetical protein
MLNENHNFKNVKNNGGIGFHEIQQLNSRIKIDRALGFYLGTDRVPFFTWVPNWSIWAPIGPRRDPI